MKIYNGNPELFAGPGQSRNGLAWTGRKGRLFRSTGAAGCNRPKGEISPWGEQGIRGAKGDKGDKCDKGDTGQHGAQGTKGDKGDTPDSHLFLKRDGSTFMTGNLKMNENHIESTLDPVNEQDAVNKRYLEAQ